ncbi:hypothetical protein D770_08275 [Flammeovirgaceae bacterium 311]|nr:hypothetical protein D770_08275 [Flammeovirgaceae bacterium 311]
MDFAGQEASDLIMKTLSSDKPAMISRFGAVEIQCVYEYLTQPNFENSLKYIKGEIDSIGWSRFTFEDMPRNAGFFPPNVRNFEKFSELMLAEMEQIDILGSWRAEENLFKEELKNAKKVRLRDLEPYYHPRPWSQVLEGKKVLVIHPFEESIRHQYQKRALLFSDKRILPQFDLTIIKAVQSIAHNKVNFKDWFEALEYMKEAVAKEKFDIALMGCGAYGMPLASFVKLMGKQAVHMGGALQILFGIRGARWESHETISKLFNKHWIKPLQIDYPDNFMVVEEGCYW